MGDQNGDDPGSEDDDEVEIRVMHAPLQRRTEYRNTWNKTSSMTLQMHSRNA